MSFYGIVYLVTNKKNKKKYVGITTTSLDERWYNHCKGSKRCRLLSRAIDKYGPYGFTIEEITSCQNKEDLIDMETYFIDYYKSFVDTGHGYNLTTGGGYNGKSSEETKELISQGGINRYAKMTAEERKEDAKHLLQYIHPKKPAISFNISTGVLTKYPSYFSTGFAQDFPSVIKRKGTRGNCYWYDYDPEFPDSHYIEESMGRLGGRLWTENEMPIKSVNLITREEKIYNNIFETFKEGYSNSAIRKVLTGVIDSTGGCSWEPVGYEIPKITRVLKDRKGCKFSEEHKKKLSEAAKNRKCEIKPGMRTRTPHTMIDGLAHKTCYNCKTLHSLENYHGDNKRWDKKSDLCKGCHRDKVRLAYQKKK